MKNLLTIHENNRDLFLQRLSENQEYLEALEYEEDEDSFARDAIVQKIIETKALYIEYFLEVDITTAI